MVGYGDNGTTDSEENFYFVGFIGVPSVTTTAPAMVSGIIDSSGGTLSSTEGCTITVPAGAVSDGTTFSITPVTSDTGQIISLSGGGSANIVNHFYLDTSAPNKTFNAPITIDLTWPANANIDLSKLVVIKDGVVITTPCSTSPCVPQTANCTICNCNAGTRTFTVSVTGFSEFIIGETSEATIIKLSSFTATPKAGKVILEWSTDSEIDNAGFNIYRAESENGNYAKINSSIITAKGSATQGASYEFTDNNVLNRKTYYYKLEDIDLNGKSTMHGPVNATPRLIYGIGK